MIITRTPFRVSLFGGGTDYPAWYKEHGGAVIGAAIDKYCYLHVRRLPPFFGHRHRIVYSKIELVDRIDEIAHPVVRAVLEDADLPYGVEIHHAGDLPARAGLGSSSSFSVGILHALALLQGQETDKRGLAHDAINLEQVRLAEAVGCQDQVWAAYGGFNRIDFPAEGDFSVTPVDVRGGGREELENAMLLVFSGLSRYAHKIAEKQIASIGDKTAELREMRSMVDSAEAIIAGADNPVAELGRLLNEGWRLKRSLHPEVANDEIDALIEKGLAAGACGAKLLGAGGGGFVLFLCPADRREGVLQALSEMISVPVGMDFTGSIPVVNEPSPDPRG